MPVFTGAFSQDVLMRPGIGERKRLRNQARVVSAWRVVEVLHRRLDVRVAIHSWTRRTSALAIIRVPNVWRRSWKRSERSPAAASAAL